MQKKERKCKLKKSLFYLVQGEKKERKKNNMPPEISKNMNQKSIIIYGIFSLL